MEPEGLLLYSQVCATCPYQSKLLVKVK